tara:strand:- start:270 stop:524 length:255 start_codon:yes stop_codon:yes gene_type:complete
MVGDQYTVYFRELVGKLVVVAVERRVMHKRQFRGQLIDITVEDRDKTETAQVVAVVEYYLQALSVEVLAVHRVVILVGLMQTVQ